jgi:hypothetical protein
MARRLTLRDREILTKMVPELDLDHFPPVFRSILPPVSRRFSSSGSEFKSRLDKLTTSELEYLIDLIFLGEECLTGLEDTCIDILLNKVRETISQKKAEDLTELLGYIREE